MARDGNQRMAQSAPSEIRAMTAACARVKGINMAQGVCDTGSPPVVIDAAQRAMAQGVNTYTRFDGLAELRQAIAKKASDYNHLTVDPETEVTVSAGATGSFHCACLALLNPGDEVIIFQPYYGYHLSALVAVEAVPRIVALHAPTGKGRVLRGGAPSGAPGAGWVGQRPGWAGEIKGRVLREGARLWERAVLADQDGREKQTPGAGWVEQRPGRASDMDGKGRVSARPGWAGEIDWTFSLGELEAAVTGRTKAIVVNTPGNPSGKVFTRPDLEAIADCARRHDLFVFTDEIYEYFLFDGREHVSIASLPGMAERTITIGGYSKTFSITGWRIGYSLAHKKWAQMIGAMNDLLYVCAPAPLQAGVAAGIQRLAPSFYTGLAAEYQAKRDRFCAALAHAGLPPFVPQGAYYVLADASRVPGTTGKARAMHLLDATGVAGVPGEAFFHDPDGERFIRFCFAKTDPDLEEACRRIEQLQR